MSAWALAGCGSAASESASAPAAASMILRIGLLLLPLALFHDDLAEHSLLVVSGNETGELEFATLGELPEHLPGRIGENALGVGIVVLHLGKFLHHLSVLLVFLDGGEDELVILLPVVLHNEADLLAPAHLDERRLEAHLAAALEHSHLDGAHRLLRIARLAGGEVPVILVGAAGAGHPGADRERSNAEPRGGSSQDD